MANIPITVATNDYDRTRAIKDGTIAVDGCDITYLNMLPEEMFFRAVRYAEFDVTELSFSTHILQTQRGDSQYLEFRCFSPACFATLDFTSVPIAELRAEQTLKERLSACQNIR